MKVKTFGSVVTEIEKRLQNWLDVNEGVEVKHIAMGLNAASDWGIVLIVYEARKDTVLCEEKEGLSEPSKNNA